MRIDRGTWTSVTCVLAALCVMVALPLMVDAGTTGKISGRVMDSSGQPLPGASVVIEGTQRGSTADADGYFLILSMDPGVFSLKASMIGYNANTKTDVEVRADFTSTVNFDLVETAIQVGELVVIAERPPVEVDKTSSKYVVGEAEIEEVPMVRSAGEVIALQPGADVSGGETIRGSEIGNSGSFGTAADVAYYVDGVQVSHTTRHGYQRGVGQQIFTGMSKTAAQEITVVTGGMEAEYGNAQGGVISIVTREGAPSYHAWGEYRYTPSGKKHWGANVYEAPMHKDKMKWGNAEWENETYTVPGLDGVLGTDDDVAGIAHQRQAYDEVMGHAFDVNLSGPIAGNSSFMVAGDISRIANSLPSAQARGFELSSGTVIPSNGYYNLSYNVSFRPTQNFKVKLGGLYRSFDRWVDKDISYWIDSGLFKGVGDSGKNIFLREDWSGSGKAKNKDHTEYVAITHTISPKTFYEVKIARSASMIDTAEVPTYTNNPLRDNDGWFAVERFASQYQIKYRKTWQLKADFSSQVTRGHFVKAGVDLVRHGMYTTLFTQDTAVRRHIEGAGYKGIDIDKPANPVIGALYIQDKMEFEGLIINAGLRFDWLDAGEVPMLASMSKSWMYEKPSRWKNVPLVDKPMKTKLSPRLGVSHPITDKSTIHFFFGQFSQWPNLYYLYNQDWLTSAADVDWNGNGVIDGSELYNSAIVSYPQRGGFSSSKFMIEKNVSFEVGVDWNFVSDFVMASSIYYKSQSDQYRPSSTNTLDGIRKRWGAKYVLSMGNQHFDDMRGFELSLKKRFSDNYSFRVSYNLRWKTNGRNGRYNEYMMPDSIWISTPFDNGKPRFWSDYELVNGVEVPILPTAAELEAAGTYLNNYLANFKRRYPHAIAGTYVYNSVATIGEYGYKGYDQIDEDHMWSRARSYSAGILPSGDIRNSGSAQLLYATAPDYGPNVKLFGSPVLANWKMNLIYRIYTGSNFWYYPPVGQRQSRRRAIRTWTDLHVEKTFPVGGSEIAVFMEALNVFNQKDSSSNGFDYIQYGLQAPKPNDPDYLTYGDLSDRSRYFGSPRELLFGIRASF